MPYFYTRVDEEIRQRVEAKLTSHYGDLAVNVRFAKLVEGEGIEIRGLSILDPKLSGVEAELVYIDEIFLACGTELQELCTGVPNVEHIWIRRPRLRMTRRADGSWSSQRLWPPPKLSENPADITIENGTLEVADSQNQPASLLTLRELNFSVTHEHLPADAQRPLPRHEMLIAGTLTGDHLRRVELKGRLVPQTGEFDFQGLVEELEFSPELLAALPAPQRERLHELGDLRAQIRADFSLRYNPALAEPLEFEVASQLSRGRIDDPRLPHPLNDVRATVRCDNKGLVIENLSARNGPTQLKLSGQRLGYDARSPLSLAIESRRLHLDERLFESLPEELQEVWQKFFPSGEIDLNATLHFDGRTWRPELTVDCLNVSFLPHLDRFPYRLERGAGTIELKDDVLDLDLTTFSGADEVHITAHIEHPGADFIGEIKATAPVVRFDDKLFAALPESSRGVIRSLNPSGSFNCVVHCWRNDPSEDLHKNVWGRFNHCALRYDKFPYPLTNIRGSFEMRDNHWNFKDLEGSNDTGMVQCHGHFKPLEAGSELLLHFTAQNLPLEEELRESLPSRSQELWNLLRPRGTVDVASSQVRYLSQEKKLSVEFRLEPHSDSTSIEPAAFPYRMEKLRGGISFREGRIEIDRLRAEHGRTEIAAQGHVDCPPEGGWRLSLDDLTVDRLQADRDLVAALPGRLRKLVAELNPTGPINLHGALNLFGSAVPALPVAATWDMAIEFNQGSLEAGVHLENLVGGLRLMGRFDGEKAQAWGDLNFDSLMYKDVQLTEVLGPLWIDDTRVVLGMGAEAPGQDRRRITAKLYGGNLIGDGWVALGALPRYSLEATLVDADLERFTQEAVSGRQKLSGKVRANIGLRGEGRGLHALEGRGNLQLREADIYELPLMVSLLKILSVRPPDTTAFTESDIDFVIRGNHVYFNRMNFNGDAISLRGDGEMNFDKEIHLTFRAAVGKRELKLPLISDVMKGASQQVMQIHVQGTVDSPVTTAEAFPGVNKAFKDLEAGLGGVSQ